MRKTIALALTAAALGLAGCSEKTQEQAAQTAESIEQDVSAAASDATAEAEKSADRLGAAANEGAASIGAAADAAGDELSKGAARIESDVQDEPAAESKAD